MSFSSTVYGTEIILRSPSTVNGNGWSSLHQSSTYDAPSSASNRGVAKVSVNAGPSHPCGRAPVASSRVAKISSSAERSLSSDSNSAWNVELSCPCATQLQLRFVPSAMICG